MLILNFFSAPLVLLDNQPLRTLTASPILLSLLAYLVMHRERPLARSFVAAAFWPESTEAQARRNLNSHLYRLRMLLGSAEFLCSERETIQFDPHAAFWLDVLDFESRTAQLVSSSAAPLSNPTDTRALEEAAALYRGEFLEGIFDDWVLPHRERLHERYLLTLNRLVETYRAQEDFDAAIRAARQWMQEDSFCEAAHYHLIRLYAQSNRLNQARAQFQHYQTIWRNELRVEPSARILALADQYQLVAPPTLIQNAAARLTQLEDTLEAHRQLDKRKAATQERQRPVEELYRQIAQQAQELGLAFKKRGTPGKAARYLMRALNAFAALPDSPWRREQEWSVRVACDELYDLDANWNAALENLGALEQLANQFGEPSRQAEVLARLAWAKIGQGCYPEAIVHAETALHISMQHRNWAHASWAQRLLGVAYDRMGDFRAALAHYRAALAIDETSGSPEHLPTDLNNIGCIVQTMGDYATALREFERARSLLLPQTPLQIKLTLRANLGNLWTKLEQFDAAQRELKQALEWFKRLGERERECWVAACLARLYQRRGERDRALVLAHHYYLRAQRIPAPQRMAELVAILAAVYIEQHDAVHAREWAEQLESIAATQNLWRYRVRAAMRLAQAYHLLAQPTQAFNWARRAVALVQEGGQPLEETPELYAIVARCESEVGTPMLQPQ